MNSMLLSLWDDFRNWITTGWTDTTYMIVVCVFAVFGLLSFYSFFRWNINKGKKIKWGSLVFTLIMFALLALVSVARYA